MDNTSPIDALRKTTLDSESGDALTEPEREAERAEGQDHQKTSDEPSFIDNVEG